MKRIVVSLAVFVFGLVPGLSATAQTAPQATIVTVAGTGSTGMTVRGTRHERRHRSPQGIAVLPDGSFVFAEPFFPSVRRVAADGRITTVAGTAAPGFSGDGGPATSAQLNLVHGVALLPDGSMVLADTSNHRIRRVSPNGTITTVAGTGTFGFSGDGGPATAAQIAAPRGIASLADGTILFPDSGNHRVRRISPAGVITTVAGTGTPGSLGDGGPASAAQLNLPFGVSPLADGGFLIADAGNSRIRRVDRTRHHDRRGGAGVAARGRRAAGRRLSRCRHDGEPCSPRVGDRGEDDSGGDQCGRLLRRRGAGGTGGAQPAEGAGRAPGSVRVRRRLGEQPGPARAYGSETAVRAAHPHQAGADDHRSRRNPSLHAFRAGRGTSGGCAASGSSCVSATPGSRERTG